MKIGFLVVDRVNLIIHHRVSWLGERNGSIEVDA